MVVLGTEFSIIIVSHILFFHIISKCGQEYIHVLLREQNSECILSQLYV